jgi:cytochrome P450
VTSRLLELLADGELRDEREVRTILYSILGGGHVSTGPFIASAVVRLLQHPDQFALVVADHARWPAVVEEVLRYDSAVQSARDRYALEPIDVGGVHVAKDEVVLLSLAAANRDPARFERPEEFDIRRTPSPHLAFSHGTHFCPGSRLARTEGVIALSTLFDRLPDLRLTRPDEPIEWSFGPALRGPARVPVSFAPRPR